MQFSTRQSKFYTLLLFISFDAWTSTLHLTEVPILHSILTPRISPVTASNFKLNVVYFQLNFWIFVDASVIIGRDKRSLCRGGRWRPIDLLPHLFRPSCFLKKGVGRQQKTSASSQTVACSFETIWAQRDKALQEIIAFMDKENLWVKSFMF